MFIIGLLAAIAIPVYLSHSTRTKIAEALVLSTSAQRTVEEYWRASGVFPDNNATAGADPGPNYRGAFVSRIDIASGIVTASFDDPALSDGVIVLTPSEAGSGLIWSCSSPNIPSNLLPPDCR